MENVPFLTSFAFILTVIATVWLFYEATGKNKKVVYGILLWAMFVGTLGAFGFYQDADATPPRLFFLLGPAVLFILVLFLTQRGKRMMDTLNIKWLTILHIIRIPVEILLYAIFLNDLIPIDMTFEGSNPDILSGLTAPVIYYFAFIRKTIGRRFLLYWNLLCLVLLVNIVTIAILSAQTPFQQLAFDQPNIGITYFPFVWLPAIIVPLVLLAHLVSIRKLLDKTQPLLKTKISG